MLLLPLWYKCVLKVMFGRLQVVYRKNSDAATDEDRNRLDTVGMFHTGEFINRFRHGSLVMRLPDSELSDIPTLLYGSVDGSLGVIASLPKELFDFLNKLQDQLRKVTGGGAVCALCDLHIASVANI